MSKRRDFCKRGHPMSVYRKTYNSGYTFCSECKRLQAKSYYEENIKHIKSRLRFTNLRSRYGLKDGEYENILSSQEGKCAICGTSEFIGNGPHVDHNHLTKKVRGILCTKCNVGLGYFCDDPEILIKASNYLRKVR